MRATFLVLAAVVPAAACTESLTTAPPPVVRQEPAEVADVAVSLRDRNARADTLPILIIDGQIRVLGRLEQLNPNDLESVVVIKAASTAALYGSGTQCPAIVVRTRP
jgi:hypothetical protein